MRTARFLFALLFAATLTSAAQQKPAATDVDYHQLEIYGIEIGMNPEQVLNKMGRAPNNRRDLSKNEFEVYWKMPNNDVLQVRLRNDFVSFIGVQFNPSRSTIDFWLAQPASPTSTSALTAADPRRRQDYKLSETDDKQRVVWKREVKDPAGFRVDIQFLSASKAKLGDRNSEEIEFKYVGVTKDDLKKFDQIAMGSPAK